MIRICKTCRKTFQSDKNVYCSEKCRPKDKTMTGNHGKTIKARTRECLTCKSNFTPTLCHTDFIYCSQRCTPKGLNRNGKPRKKHPKCTDAYKEIQRHNAKRQWKEWRKKNPRPTDDPGPFPPNWECISNLIKKRDDNTCLLCNQQKDNPPVHHIDHDRSNNDPANLATVCHKCHKTKPHYRPKKKEATGLNPWLRLWLRNREHWQSFFNTLMNQPDMKKKNEDLRKAMSG